MFTNMSFLTFILILAVVIAGIVLALWAMKSNRKASETDESVPPAPEPAPAPEEDLVALNLELRKAGVDLTLTKQCEVVIDKLINLMPKVKAADTADGELSWTVNRIATDYLPNKCVKPFLKVGDSSPDAVATFRDSLTVLSDELDDVGSTISRRDEQAFNRKAQFLKHRFANDGDLS